VAGAIGRGLAVGLGVGIGDGVAGPALPVGTVGLEIGDGVAGPALPVGTVGLGGVFEQATTASARKKIEPVWAIRPVPTFALLIVAVAVVP
jgi:hypothetical protein